MAKVKTRIAPSPTGQMHIGTVRTALFNYLYAKNQGGTYFVRIEDTDKERNKAEWVDAIWEDFSWCGLEPDERYIQSEHLGRHRELLHKLVESGRAYISKEPKKDDPTQSVEVVRLKNPGQKIVFNDLIRGEVAFDTTELGDFVIARSIDDPLYHFAVVADDADAGVTHVIRAEEHISNTPRQILILEALGFERPAYAHLPLILAPDRSKLSKRKHGASIENYRAQGFLPQAIINYLALLGWNPGTPQEIFSMDELVKAFSLEQVQKSGAVFDIQKLRWFNREYMKMLGESEFKAGAEARLKQLGSDIELDHLLPLLRERLEVWGDMDALFGPGGELHFITVPDPALDVSKISWKGESGAIHHLREVSDLIKNAPKGSFESPDAIKAVIWPYADAKGRGSVLWPVRYSLTGQDRSPDPFAVISILGKAESLRRLDQAIELLQ